MKERPIMVHACSRCRGTGLAWHLLAGDHALDWGDDCFPWGEATERICRECGGRGVLGADELEAELDALKRPPRWGERTEPEIPTQYNDHVFFWRAVEFRRQLERGEPREVE